MFRKVLIANRGEIAVRILRACQELGIATVAVYTASDRSSLHVRLADECVLLPSPAALMDADMLVAIARSKDAQAIHPGYGFLAEEKDLAQACQRAGIAFIGPQAETLALTRDKILALSLARAAQFRVVPHSQYCYKEEDLEALNVQAKQMGFPLVVKSCRGGRGRGDQLVRSPAQLAEAVRRAQAESQALYADRRVYLEQAILPYRQVGVQILADQYGNLIHLGERECSLRSAHNKVIMEAPAPSLSDEQRQEIRQAAVRLARLFGLQNACTIEFLLDEQARFYFTEVKARIQREHCLTEMVTRFDLVQEQIRIGAGEKLSLQQEEVNIQGWAMQCHLLAQDPQRDLLPNSGQFEQVRLPGGPEVRVDTYLLSGGEVPAEFDPLVAKLITWGRDRQACLNRLRHALQEVELSGLPTNLSLLRHILNQHELAPCNCDTNLSPAWNEADSEMHLRNLAAAAAVLYLRRYQTFRPVVPERLTSGWHRNSRRLNP